MENPRSSLLNWGYYYQGKDMDELRHSLLCTTMELERTKQSVVEELRKRDDQLIHLKDMLNIAIRERDEAQQKCQSLLLENLLIQQQQQQQQQSGISSIEDEPRRGIVSNNNGLSSSDCEESIVSSPVVEALPEKGKLLEAVMKAGPLLQTLMLAGPLPQWRHPPPSLDTFEIPYVSITPPNHF